MTEEWRPVDGWPYEVSDCGRVRRSGPAMGTQPGRVLRFQRGWGARCGYHSVMLRDNPRAKWFLVHHLVAHAFVGEPPFAGAIINHKNGVKTDNRPSNLEWTDRAGNNRHAGRHDLVSFGEDHCFAKLTTRAVEWARERYDRGGVTCRELADAAGVSHASMYAALIGKTWRRAGGPLMQPIPGRRGEKHGMAKLSRQQVVEIKRLLSGGLSRTDIATRFGVSYGCIDAIEKGRTWRHVAA